MTGWRRRPSQKAEQGIATLGVVVIVTAVLAGGAAVAYVATDGFGTRGDSEPVAVSTTPPTPTASEPEPSAPAADPIPLPDGFPDIGVPIYAPAELVASPDHGDELWVLEYVTPDELIDVNIFVEERLVRDENDWHGITQTVEGEMTITEAITQGYRLVIAVGPERVDGTLTSLHYTLRAE